MTRLSVFSALYVKNITALEIFVQRFPGSIIITSELHSEEDIQRLAKAGGTMVSIYKCLPFNKINEIKADVAQRIVKLKEVFSSVSWKDYCKQHDWPSDELALHAGNQVTDAFEVSALLAAALELCHQIYRFNLVMVNEDWTAASQAIINWAKTRNTPCLHVAHGSFFGAPPPIERQLYSDCTAVFGERDLKTYTNLGTDPNKIAIIGNPDWDSYADLIKQRSTIRRQVIERHAIPDNIPLVVFGTPWASFQSSLDCELVINRTIEAFIIACKKLRGSGFHFQAVIKDRTTTISLTEPLLKQLCIQHDISAASILHVSDDPKEWIIAADVLVSVSSSLSVEACSAGTPAINLLDPAQIMTGPFFDVDLGIVEVASDELHLAIFELITNQALRNNLLARTKQAAPRYNLGVDGLATQRLAELMGRLATRS